MRLRTIRIDDGQRGLLLRGGRFERLLEPGRHRIWDWNDDVLVNVAAASGAFVSPLARVIEREHPALAAEIFAVVRPAEHQAMLVWTDGQPTLLVRPGHAAHVWKVGAEVRVQTFDVVAEPRVDRLTMQAVQRLDTAVGGAMVTASVASGQAALLYFDSRLQEVLEPGVYGYWIVARKVTTRMFSMRSAAIEVTAQEILTRDRVQLRVTLTAFVRVTDPVRLAAATDDHEAYVYKLVQFATREAVGGRTLDEVLGDRDTIDAQILDHVRRQLGDVGLAIEQLGIKDAILPGEMRVLINKVVEAEKVAQANLIRRREETAATRALLNTARLIDENPTVMRLKELEALERVTEKIGAITVHAGADEGLNAVVNRLVTLRAPAPRPS